MLQQIIALIIIAFFIFKLFWQKKNNQISGDEFLFWLLFWFSAGLSIIFLKYIDLLVLNLGFSGKGIDILLYIAVALNFYFIFRLRLRQAKIDKQITKIVRHLALEEHKKK